MQRKLKILSEKRRRQPFSALPKKMKRKNNFVLGGDIEEALRNLASINGAPVTKKINTNPVQRTRAARKPYASQTAHNDLFDWFKLMKPSAMGKWNWLVLVHWQVCQSGPTINIDDFSKALDIKKDKINLALNDLAKEEYIRITREDRDSDRTIISKTVELKLGEEWGVKTIFS